METITTGIGIYYDHTKKDDKHFFGGFANLAINNVTSLFEAFRIKFGITQNLTLENFIDVCLKEKLSDYDFQIRLSFIKSHFPVVQYLDERNRKNFKSQLSSLFLSVDKLRSFYSHYYHPTLSFTEDLYILLNDVFVRVTNDVKLHKMKDDKSRHLLSKTLTKELDIRTKEQIEKLKLLKQEGKKVNLHDKTAIMNAVLNTSFNHLIFKNENSIIIPTRRYESKYIEIEPAENGITISQSGLLFILSFFLKRKENEDLKSRVRGFKAKTIKDGEEKISGLKFMATHWVFSYLSFRDIKQSLNTEFAKETLLVQIIDELSKVPDELYNSFHKNTQDSFIEDINEYLKEGNSDYTLDESKVVHPVIRKRYEDKSNYFAIRYLDEFAGFKSLRFQIHLGNYIHDKREKTIGGTTFSTERSIKERIKVFGKLSDAHKLKSEFFQNKDYINEKLGWELLPNPSYIFIENNIPIYLKSTNEVANEVKFAKDERRKVRPEERKGRNPDKKRKHEIVNEISKGAFVTNEPTALLSMNEIPPLLYEILRKEKTTEEIEGILKAKISERVNTIKNYDPSSPLPASAISKRIRNNCNQGESINVDSLLKLLQKDIISGDQKLSQISKNRLELSIKEKGKHVRNYTFGFAELGREATWLADDIKRFMPENVRKEWKGYQHSQLQQSLAFFESRPKEAYAILNETWDFSDDSILWNEWIKKSFTQKFFDKFYETYLLGRKLYLQSVLDGLESFKDESKKRIATFIKQQLPKNFFSRRLYILESLENEKNKILSNPLIFNRGLFDSKPTFIVGKKVQEYPEDFAEWYRYGYSEEHSLQKFYSFERNYDMLFSAKEAEQRDLIKNFSLEKGLEVLKKKQDLKIKNIKIQDLFLKLIAEKLFSEVFDHPVDIHLSDLYLTQVERIEKENNALKQSFREIGDTSSNIVNDNFIWSKTVSFFKGQINEPKIKLKDLGKFKYLLNDPKVERLLSYDLEKVWSKMEIENETSTGSASYEVIRRENLFKEIQLIEKYILSKYNLSEHPTELEKKNHPNFKMYIVNGVLRKRVSGIKESDCDWFENLMDKDFENMDIDDLLQRDTVVVDYFLLVMIRNKFAHNQLPAKKFYNYLVQKHPEKKGETTAQTFLNFIRFISTEIKNDFK